MCDPRCGQSTPPRIAHPRGTFQEGRSSLHAVLATLALSNKGLRRKTAEKQLRFCWKSVTWASSEGLTSFIAGNWLLIFSRNFKIDFLSHETKKSHRLWIANNKWWESMRSNPMR